MKLIGLLLIIGMLFTYAVVPSVVNCPEGHHQQNDRHQRTTDHNTGSMQLGCGYSFHCPVLYQFNNTGSSLLPFVGELVLASTPDKGDNVVQRIFHPPREVEFS
jgi:hypothetical protein